MITPTRTLAAVAAGALLLAGCADDDTAAASTEHSVTGTDELEFVPDSLVVPAGEEIVLELTSEGSVEHDLVVAGAAGAGEAGDEGHGDHGDEDGHAEEGDLHVAHAAAGATSTATFVIDEPGDYEFYCGVAGHREAGMTGTLVVTDD